MAEQEQNRTENATPFKLAEARKQGQVAKSLDFNSFVVVCGVLLVLVISGGTIAVRFADLSAWLMRTAGELRFEGPGEAGWLGGVLMAVASIIAPLILFAAVFAALANLIQTGPVFSFVPLKPKFERINPVAGFKRIFSKRMLFEVFKTLVKLGLFSALLYGFFVAAWPGITGAAFEGVQGQVSAFARNTGALLLRLGLALLVVALLDLAYTRWQFGKQMMMSRRELKEEVKRREGDPLIRAKIRELQRENLKQARSLGRVPEADVLITNPEHFAVALRYARGEMAAPHVIAKGADAWALEMRAIARQHGVPVYERRKLARHLFRRGQLDQPIPPDAFLDVARTYADLEAQRRRAGRYEVGR